MRRSNEVLNPSTSDIGLYKRPSVCLVGFIVTNSSLAKTASVFFTSEIACLFYGCYFFPFDGSCYFLSIMVALRLTMDQAQIRIYSGL